MCPYSTGFSNGDAERELAKSILSTWITKNGAVPRRIVILLHDVKADDESFRRALDCQVGNLGFIRYFRRLRDCNELSDPTLYILSNTKHLTLP